MIKKTVVVSVTVLILLMTSAIASAHIEVNLPQSPVTMQVQLPWITELF